MAQLGLNVADVQEVVEVAIGGRVAGQVYDGDRRFDIIVRLPENLRTDIEGLKRLPIPLAARRGGDVAPASRSERYIPLGSVAEFEIATGPNQVGRENGKRRVIVTANVRGRDIGSFVAEAEQRIQEGVTIPPG